jgi:hypothetical protein
LELRAIRPSRRVNDCGDISEVLRADIRREDDQRLSGAKTISGSAVRS